MAREGMDNLQKLLAKKIGRRTDELRELAWTERQPVEDCAVAETMDHLSLADAKRLKYRKVRGPHRWGKPWSTLWLRLRIHVPKAFAGEPVALLCTTGGECILFRDGKPVQGLDHNRRDLLLTPRAKGGERIELYIEAGASDAFGRFEQRTLEHPEIAVYHDDVWAAYHDLACLNDQIPLAKTDWWGAALPILQKDSTRRARLIHELARAVDAFDYLDDGREGLRRSARRLRKALKPLYDCKANASAQTLACMGHAHIDVAWLWPLAETIRKCGRTFSNVLALMDRYPDFLFCQSQPHLYEFARDRYPDLYKRIKQKAKKGQWIPTGAAWVEMDCNVTSGESLVRQLLFGSRFFKDEFNHDACCLWLPDVFGYSAALPQILQRSGVPYFLTQKISWSQFTTFPYHSFWWEGIDGTKVLTHFPPVATYNACLTPDELLRAARDYREKDRCDIQAVPFGFGDGGGGPTAGQIERMHRYADLEELPKTTPMAPREFFQRLEAQSDDLPRWVGELYLELHRGTLTTQAWNKRYNRLCELGLREAEWLAAFNRPDGAALPRKAIHEAWKTVLLNQFHDIIPGSSIDLVYRDSDRQYQETLATVGELRDAAAARYAKQVDTRGEGTPVLVLNSLARERTDIAAVAINRRLARKALVAVGPDGTETPVQVGADGLARFRATVPSMGHAVVHLRPGTVDAPSVRADAKGLENERLRVRLDAQGRVRSVYDKVNRREALAAGAIGNQLQRVEDKPAQFDAWDIDLYYDDKPLAFDGELVSLEVLEAGPVRGVVRVVRRISRSTVTQDIVLAAGAGRVDFVNEMAWGDEKEVLLKVAFPVDVRNDTARYEIQFGNVERPTHWNMPQDFGRFEVAAQKWADLSEADYGVALLNDCKYGHDTRDNVMRISLLRAPKAPDPTADVGKTHRFTYSLYPHAGDYTHGVVDEGYALNVPLTAVTAKAGAGALPPVQERLAVSGDNVVVETVKPAEDDDDALIVRLYEAHGCRGRRTVRFDLPVKKVIETDLMEREEKTLSLRDGRVRLTFGPFQIRTLKLMLKGRKR